MTDQDLIARITTDPRHFGGKPIIRGRRLAVEHVLGMVHAGASYEDLLEGYPWLERADIDACLLYECSLAGPEVVEPLRLEKAP